MKINYSFKMNPPAPAPALAQRPKERLAEYSYNEFWIDLPEHWRQVPVSHDRTVQFYSDVEGASITISVDFYEVSDEKVVRVAEKLLETHTETISTISDGKGSVLKRSIKPHSGGVGLEASIAADLENGSIFVYLGYVTTRKIFNLTLIAKADRMSAAALFNNTMANLRVKLP